LVDQTHTPLHLAKQQSPGIGRERSACEIRNDFLAAETGKKKRLDVTVCHEKASLPKDRNVLAEPQSTRLRGFFYFNFTKTDEISGLGKDCVHQGGNVDSIALTIAIDIAAQNVIRVEIGAGEYSHEWRNVGIVDQRVSIDVADLTRPHADADCSGIDGGTRVAD
jgi:hypothetical protein